jgi:hypothetical protein
MTAEETTTTTTPLQRYQDQTFTPTEQAKIRVIAHELRITHPTLPESFVTLIAQVGAISTDEELAAMLENMGA